MTQLLPASQTTEQTRELVTPQAAHQVLGTNGSGQPRSDDPEQFVAGVVPMRVIDRLEAVEVEVQQGEQLALRLAWANA